MFTFRKMKSFAIFLWIFTGHVSCDLERGNVALEDLLFNVVTKEAVRVHSVPEHTQSGEISSLDSFTPVVTRNSSTVTKPWKTMRFGTIAEDRQAVRKLTARRNRIIPESLVIITKERKFADHATRRIRRKRQIWGSRCAKRSKSMNKYGKILDRFPSALKDVLVVTDDWEGKILNSYGLKQDAARIKTDTAGFMKALRNERKVMHGLFKETPATAPELLNDYRKLRPGKSWNHRKLDPAYDALFMYPNPYLKVYNAVKREELDVDIEDPTSTSQSRKLFTDILAKVPKALKKRIILTDDAEKKLLGSYVTSGSAPTDVLAAYNVAKKKERKQLKRANDREGYGKQTVVANYKALRKGKTWNYIKLKKKFKKFFKTHSAALKEYEALKRDELASLDSFLAGENQEASQEKSSNSDDPSSVEKSYEVFRGLRSAVPEKIRKKIILTDGAETRLLESYAKSNSAPTNVLAAYNAAKLKERTVLKNELAKAGDDRARVLAHYKALRKGKVWNFNKLKDTFKVFFETPSNGLKEYEDLKRDELASIDSFLGGSSQSVEAEYRSRNQDVGKLKSQKVEEKKATADKAHKKEKAKAGERYQGQEDEMVEERKGRAPQEAEKSEIETLANREQTGEVDAATNDSTASSEVFASPDIATSADITNAGSSETAKAKDTKIQVGLAILLAMVISMITVTLILRAQRKKITECCRREKGVHVIHVEGETEPFHPGFWNSLRRFFQRQQNVPLSKPLMSA